MPTLVEYGADVFKIDELSKPKFNWEWMDVEYTIEVIRYKWRINLQKYVSHRLKHLKLNNIKESCKPCEKI